MKLKLWFSAWGCGGLKRLFNCLFVCLCLDSTERKYLGIMRLITSNYNHYWWCTDYTRVREVQGEGRRGIEGGGTTRCLINRTLRLGYSRWPAYTDINLQMITEPCSNNTDQLVTGTRFNKTGQMVTWARSNMTGQLVTWAGSNKTGQLVTWARSNKNGQLVTWASSNKTGHLVTWARSNKTGHLVIWAWSNRTGHLVTWAWSNKTGQMVTVLE